MLDNLKIPFFLLFTIYFYCYWTLSFTFFFVVVDEWEEKMWNKYIYSTQDLILL